MGTQRVRIRLKMLIAHLTPACSSKIAFPSKLSIASNQVPLEMYYTHTPPASLDVNPMKHLLGNVRKVKSEKRCVDRRDLLEDTFGLTNSDAPERQE